ncbi:MAG: response regulator [Methanobacteriota archaeon]|nr:MAG: response regulator [Euryarchaeota archaeon]
MSLTENTTLDEGKTPTDREEKPTIIVAEDDPAILNLISTLLTRSGYNTIPVTNGTYAVEKYKELMEKGVRPIVVMDHRMPVKNGLEASKEILSINKEAKILILSADVFIKERALQIGVKKFLDKPVRFNELLLAIKNIAILNKNN